MFNHSSNGPSLFINVASASELDNVEHFGKQDPYVRLALDFTSKDAYVKTYTQKNAGTSATWNQNFTFNLNGEPDLFVEVLDEESSVDEVIGFAAIPINQIVYAPGAQINGIFEIFNNKGNRAGLINLQLAAAGFPNSQPPNFQSEPVQGQSYIHEEHAAKCKSTNKKAAGVSAGGILLGGALAIGAGFLGKKLYDDHQEKEEQERLEQEEEERRQQEEAERLQREEEGNGESENRYGEDGEYHGHHRRGSNSSEEGDDDVRKWNPVGTYAAGERVRFHGNTYLCLQGHTSNPTWQPTVAHSLWQSE